MNKMNLNKNKLLKILLLIFIVFMLFMYVNYESIKEGYSSKQSDLLEIKNLTNFADSWCQNTSGTNLENACKHMDKDVCKKMSCCVLAKTGENENCLAGNKNGTLFGKQPDYYYFKEKCYGDSCP
jgi:hypothetical protein